MDIDRVYQNICAIWFPDEETATFLCIYLVFAQVQYIFMIFWRSSLIKIRIMNITKQYYTYVAHRGSQGRVSHSGFYSTTIFCPLQNEFLATVLMLQYHDHLNFCWENHR